MTYKILEMIFLSPRVIKKPQHLNHHSHLGISPQIIIVQTNTSLSSIPYLTSNTQPNLQSCQAVQFAQACFQNTLTAHPYMHLLSLYIKDWGKGKPRWLNPILVNSTSIGRDAVHGENGHEIGVYEWRRSKESHFGSFVWYQQFNKREKSHGLGWNFDMCLVFISPLKSHINFTLKNS